MCPEELFLFFPKILRNDFLSNTGSKNFGLVVKTAFYVYRETYRKTVNKHQFFNSIGQWAKKIRHFCQNCNLRVQNIRNSLGKTSIAGKIKISFFSYFEPIIFDRVVATNLAFTNFFGLQSINFLTLRQKISAWL